MIKKIAILFLSVVLLAGLSLKLTYFKNPWKVPHACFGHKKGTEFEMTQEIQLIKNFYGYHLKPITYRINGQLIEDTDVKKVLPSGTRLKFTRIEQKEDWNTGKYYVQYGEIITPGYHRGEIFIGNLLHEGLKPSSEYLIPVR